jgi:hypothetical protein
MDHSAGDWSLVIYISKVDNGLNLTILSLKDNKYIQRNLLITVPPFYVGADIWELEFGSTLMTLDHPVLLEHPARIMWDKWNVSIEKDS